MRPGASGGDGRRLDDGRRAELEARAYDPRREERRKLTRLALPEDADPRMLDPDARRELRSLMRETADLVAGHLVMTGRLLDDDPEQALAHARAARAMAGRIGVVREAAGLAAYAAGEWNEAVADLRAARRITGQSGHLAVLADCERALGRPERALAYADDPAVPGLDQAERVELVIVLSGARRDLGQADAAVLALQEPARRTSAGRPWAARLWYAYADALLHAGRPEQARTWFEKVTAVDTDGATDAGDRLLALDGVVLEDLTDDEDEAGSGLPDEELAAYVAEAFPRPEAAAEREPDLAPDVEGDVASDAGRDLTADLTADLPADVESAVRPGDDAAAPTAPGPAFAAPVVASAVDDATSPSDEGGRRASSPVLLPVFASPPEAPAGDEQDDERA